MAVVINEFEVIPGEATPIQSATPPTEQSETSPQPEEIEMLLERERERWERVWAH